MSYLNRNNKFWVGIVTTILITSYLTPHKEPHTVFEQTSPGLLSHNTYKESRDTAPLSKNGKIQQRLWLPAKKIHNLTFFLRTKDTITEPPKLTVLADNNNEPGSSIAEVKGQITGPQNNAQASYNTSDLDGIGPGWIWIQFTEPSSSTAIRFYRNIDEQLYPGGRLIIDDPPRHQEQGVLAFRMTEIQYAWPSSFKALAFTLGICILLLL